MLLYAVVLYLLYYLTLYAVDHGPSTMDCFQLIQLIPASGFHLVVDFFSLVQNSMELLPVMSPTPNLLSFQPPNEKGSRGTGTPTFTPIMPALAFSMMYRAMPPFCVN